MHKKIYQRINFAVYLLIALFGAILQSTFLQYGPLRFFRPDILFILAVYLGYKRKLIEGGVLISLMAFIYETHSSSPSYYLMTLYLYTFLLAKLISRVMTLKNTWLSMSSIVCSLYFLKEIASVTFLGLNNHYMNFSRHLFFTFMPSLIAQAVLTPFLFRAFLELDLKTWSDEHAEDEYDLNKGF